ncbi:MULTISPECIES: porin family protein [Mesonia]|uniref:Uncharacterized protein n=1 Tax=Mesonia oceanica TaxID=2687242 RepID=A0AC61YAQ8_9FLAO|nr:MULTISPECIES: porin family protein [Mesonia]MBJ96978.1 hypothetical protein [Flavobacteriaceae bacterium]MAN25924.1 hypothetical protein [Mesonia sp.]MAN26155.1 hypothetical protein [Mesonia sp.]MAQ39523.1 hypothetical protein [Mesonia sp.]VVV01591.1 hypothetical protein FVB9532_02883 [Mesonia oceanica]
MKKLFLTLTTVLFSTFLFAQINFEKGYIITERGNRLEVFIKNEDWKNNPTSIDYKNSLESDKESISIESIKEFGIENTSKYVKFTVNIDVSPIHLSKLDRDKEPNFEEKTILLKTLVEGPASLYKFEKGNNRKYFYKTNDKDIEQLVFKEYRYKNYVKSNNHFRQQIYNNLKCDHISNDKIRNIKYEEKSLTKLFKAYNSCKDPNYKEKFKKTKESVFHLNIRPGISLMSMSSYIENSPNSTVEFDKKASWRIGLEGEFILPFNNDKWSIFAEVAYQKYTSEGKFINYSGSLANQEIDYSYLDIAIGPRFYLFLNEKSKFFINLAYIPNLALNKEYENLEITNSANLGLGIGFKYLDKYGLEVRYGFDRNIINYQFRYTEYNTLNFIFSYTIF